MCSKTTEERSETLESAGKKGDSESAFLTSFTTSNNDEPQNRSINLKTKEAECDYHSTNSTPWEPEPINELTKTIDEVNSTNEPNEMNDAIEAQSAIVCKQILNALGVVHENADDIVDFNKEIDVILTKLDNTEELNFASLGKLATMLQMSMYKF